MSDIRQLTAKHEATREDSTETLALGAGLLLALQAHPHIYGGTVPEVVVEQRRRRNRHARRARRGRTSRLAREARLNRGRNRSQRFRRGQAPHVPGISQPVDAEVVEAR